MRIRTLSCAVVSACALSALCGSASANVVTNWNNALLDAIRATSTPPPRSSRAMAMVSTAMADAVNGLSGKYSTYHVNDAAPSGASSKAAASQAAHDVLVSLYPAQAASFDKLHKRTLKTIADGQSKDDGKAWGTQVASQILALRANDHSNDVVPYVPGDQPGDWVPTPPANAAALLPNWPTVTPWTMNSGDQFRKSGPAALDSQQYADDFNEVKELGSLNSATRTPEQTDIALLWAAGGGTATPPGQWNQIAQQLMASGGNSLSKNARMFAMLNVVTADAAIVSWDMKYAYEFWRPVTAIRNADLDGNDGTDKDASWTPLIVTPPFPEYTSGHSTFSGGAAEILSLILGTDSVNFSLSNDAGTITRDFTSLEEAALEAGKSRIYGGIHFEFSNVDGRVSGQELAQWVFANFMQPVPAPGAAVGLLGLGAVGALRRRR